MKIKFKKYWRKTSFKNKEDGDFFLNRIKEIKPKNFLEIGVFHGVTSRNICELLFLLHGNDFKFTDIDSFSNDIQMSNDEFVPKTRFLNLFKTIYYRYIIRLNPYSLRSILRLLKKFKKNINIIKGNLRKVLKEINLDKIDYVFLDGGHKYETVTNDLENLTQVIHNNGTILCDDYNLSNDLV